MNYVYVALVSFLCGAGVAYAFRGLIIRKRIEAAIVLKETLADVLNRL
jgi:hypothetical protein